MTAVGILLSLVLAAPPADAATDGDECRESEAVIPTVGAEDALTRVRLYVDPVEGGGLEYWLGLRVLVGERPGEVRAELVLRPRSMGLFADAGRLRVQRWFLAASALGRTERALRMIEQQGWSAIHRKLRRAQRTGDGAGDGGDGLDGFAALAKSLEVPEEALRTAFDSPCIAEQLTDQEAIVTPNPTIGIKVGDRPEVPVSGPSPRLGELRASIDAALGSVHDPRPRPGIRFAPPVAGPGLAMDRVYGSAGVTLGGAGLEHRLLIFAEDGEQSRVANALAPALTFRSRHPGVMSVQLIAVGRGMAAIQLRRRLCAAKHLGLEVEYFTHLARPSGQRGAMARDLLEVLDPVATSDACSDEEKLERDEDDGAKGPMRYQGTWLDGRVVSASELTNLEQRFANQAPTSPVDWLWDPR